MRWGYWLGGCVGTCMSKLMADLGIEGARPVKSNNLMITYNFFFFFF